MSGRIQHNHFTREIRRYGLCPACDAYWNATLKRVIITGSRDWDDDIRIGAELARLHGEIGPFILVHGDARGADRIGAAIHEKGGWVTEAHPAKWDEYGKRAGFMRNAEMVQSGADYCLAFIRDNSKGATMCADLAEKANIPTRRFHQ